MKKVLWMGICIFFGGTSCAPDPEAENFRLVITFESHWNNSPVNQTTFGNFLFENASGELLSIERLRYLISDIALERKDGSQVLLKAYHLVDMSRAASLRLSLETFTPLADIRGISFVFGLNRSTNQDGVYPDLNAAVWNVPQAMGGGYHFMQLDGKFKTQPAVEAMGYNFHAIQAVDSQVGSGLVFEDTFFEVSQEFIPQSTEQALTVSMNVAEWFVNPHLWSLETAHSMLMSNFEAQKRMAENGKSVFSITVEEE